MVTVAEWRPNLEDSTPREVWDRLTAERAGAPYLILRNDRRHQVIHMLEPRGQPLVAGRDPEADVALVWDWGVSRAHAQFAYLGGGWLLVDDGLSTNGTFVNNERVI